MLQLNITSAGFVSVDAAVALMLNVLFSLKEWGRTAASCLRGQKCWLSAEEQTRLFRHTRAFCVSCVARPGFSPWAQQWIKASISAVYAVTSSRDCKLVKSVAPWGSIPGGMQDEGSGLWEGRVLPTVLFLWDTPSSVCAEAFTVGYNDLGLLVPPAWYPSQTQVLLLQCNNIAKLDNTLEHLENVTEINLSQNSISSVADVCLGWLPELLSLHLEENLLWELAESCLASKSSTSTTTWFISSAPELSRVSADWRGSISTQISWGSSTFGGFGTSQPGGTNTGRKPRPPDDSHEL